MINDESRKLVNDCEKELTEEFDYINKLCEYNSELVLNAFREEGISESDFTSTTGYGYNDIGRDKIEKVFSHVLKSEDALVRNQFISGSHALNVTFFALLRPGDTLLSISGKPYDTLDEVIGIKDNPSSLKSFGVNYEQIELIDNDFDFAASPINLSFPLNDTDDGVNLFPELSGITSILLLRITAAHV